MIRGEI